MNLCLPAHQHHLLWLDITTVFAIISTSFSLVLFFFTFVFLGICFFCFLLQNSLSQEGFSEIWHFWKFFWKCDYFFFRRNHPADFNWLNNCRVLKMCKVKIYVQFSLFLSARVEGNKGKNKIFANFKFSINCIPTIHS